MLIDDFFQDESLTIKKIKETVFPHAKNKDWEFVHKLYESIDWVNGDRSIPINDATNLIDTKDHREIAKIQERFNRQMFGINNENQTIFISWLSYKMLADENLFEFKKSLEWYEALCDVYLKRKASEIKINDAKRKSNSSATPVGDMRFISIADLRDALFVEWKNKHPHTGPGPQRVPQLNIPALLVCELIQDFGQKDTYKINIQDINQTAKEWGEDFIRRFFQRNSKPIPSEAVLEPEPRKPNDDVGNISDTVGTHLDIASRVDLLARSGLSEYLAKIIKRVESNLSNGGEEAFLIHLDGPWGSGKSTLLNLLASSLEKASAPSKGWIVVEFNAWQHQRVQPPWWYLMDSVFRSAMKSKSLSRCEKVKFWFREQRWRLKIGSIPAWIAIWLWIAFGFLCLSTKVVSHLSIFGDQAIKVKELGDLFELINAMIAVISSFFLAFRYLSYSLTNGSGKSAMKFIESTSDPLKHLKNHFTEMIKGIGHPVCVFIDDLDRCKQEYVVELLEGIQTLFKFTKITYVVAADRKWLSESFTESYKTFKKIERSGKSLGDLFMEKTFQISFSVPSIQEKSLIQYWHYLLNVNKNEAEINITELERKARSQFVETQDELGVKAKLEEVEQSLKDTTSNETLLYIQQLRKEAVLKLAEPEMVAKTEHSLEPFLPLLEPNPRSMKRLVNAYGIEQTIDILSDGKLSQKQLALWVILNLRWPSLAEHFKKFPDDIEKIGKPVKDETNISNDLKILFNDVSVKKVLGGKVVKEVLKKQTIEHVSKR